MRVLLGDAPAVRATFASELRRLVFHSSSKDLAQNESVQFDDLRFYDIHEIEIHIELALARQEIIRAAEEVLPQFDSLVSALLGWSSVQPTLNPLKPEAFVRALLETLTAWIPNEDVRMDLLRPSAIAMGIGLRALYREACEWMRSQGVRPVEPAAGRCARWCRCAGAQDAVRGRAHHADAGEAAPSAGGRATRPDPARRHAGLHPHRARLPWWPCRTSSWSSR